MHPIVTTVTPSLVARAREAGLTLNAWAANVRHDLEAVVGLGVDAVITDRLVEALEVARAGDRGGAAGAG